MKITYLYSKKSLLLLTILLLLTSLQGTAGCLHSTETISSESPFCVFNDYEGTSLNSAIELGNQGARFVVPWYLIEPEEGVFTFDLLDNVVDQHYAEGIQLLLTIKCNSVWGTTSPGGPGTSASSFPKNMSQYERFIQTLTERYLNKVSYWQIENEVFEPSKYWNGTKEEYIDLLHHASETIHSVDPLAIVVLQGFASSMFTLLNEGNETVQTFFEYILEEGQEYFDVVDFHQYWEPQDTYQSITLLKDTMQRFGYEKPLICTEAGDLDIRLFQKHISNPDDPIPIIEKLLSIPVVQVKIYQILSDGKVTEEELINFASFLKNHWRTQPLLECYQAENLVKRLGISLSQGVRQLYWLGMQETTAASSVDWYWTMMPLITETGRKKPHYYTYKLVIEKLHDFTSVEELQIQPDIHVIRFNKTDQNPIYIAWSSSDNLLVDLSSLIPTPGALITHIITEIGQTDEDAQRSITPTHQIKLTPTPIIIEHFEPQDIESSITGGLGCTYQVKNNGDRSAMAYWQCSYQSFFCMRSRGQKNGIIQIAADSQELHWCAPFLGIGRITSSITDGHQGHTRQGILLFPFVLFI